jgi:hypothetical protein
MEESCQPKASPTDLRWLRQSQGLPQGKDSSGGHQRLSCGLRLTMSGPSSPSFSPAGRQASGLTTKSRPDPVSAFVCGLQFSGSS